MYIEQLQNVYIYHIFCPYKQHFKNIYKKLTTQPFLINIQTAFSTTFIKLSIILGTLSIHISYGYAHLFFIKLKIDVTVNPCYITGQLLGIHNSLFFYDMYLDIILHIFWKILKKSLYVNTKNSPSNPLKY